MAGCSIHQHAGCQQEQFSCRRLRCQKSSGTVVSRNVSKLAFRHTPLSCGVVFGQQPDELRLVGSRERRASFGGFAGFVHVSTSSSDRGPADVRNCQRPRPRSARCLRAVIAMQAGGACMSSRKLDASSSTSRQRLPRILRVALLGQRLAGIRLGGSCCRLLSTAFSAMVRVLPRRNSLVCASLASSSAIARTWWWAR